MMNSAMAVLASGFARVVGVILSPPGDARVDIRRRDYWSVLNRLRRQRALLDLLEQRHRVVGAAPQWSFIAGDAVRAVADDDPGQAGAGARHGVLPLLLGRAHVGGMGENAIFGRFS